ncbi:MAG: hypothetical protein QOE79_1951 [Sphingomonadales bacterium]|jgi:glycosyltransferase involved in cell wall biosynthesis|nr:hypothetical protein [Sphingomonadales bacterium]
MDEASPNPLGDSASEPARPTISVALASYNGAAYIGEQLASLAAQTRLPDEVVICDDASTDETVAVAERFAAHAPFPLRIYRNPANLGFNGNFERALGLCRGELLFISDQDDIWYAHKIETMLRALDSHPNAQVIVNDEYLANTAGEALNATYLQNVRRLGYPDTYHVAGCCTVLRSAMLPLLLPFPAPINYDVWISWMADFLGVRAIEEEPLQLYRRHGGNSTGSLLTEESSSIWTKIRTYGLADPRSAWRDGIARLRLYRDRLDERAPVAAALAGPDAVATARARIEREAERLSQRLSLLAKPRIARLPSVMRLWRRGFYSDFAGGRSAIKDLIRG